MLTTVESVRKLSREEADLNYPVNTRSRPGGLGPNVIVHDGTGGIFVPDLTSSTAEAPEVGDYVEVTERSAAGGFAPIIEATEVTRLGFGTLPKAILPTMDELLKGSLDMEFVELRGTVTAALTNQTISLAIHGGMINVALPDISQEKMAALEHSLVRIRGPLSAEWDGESHKVIPSLVTINRAAITVDRPALKDIFSSPEKKIGELLLFDALADDLHRLKITGQIVHERKGESRTYCVQPFLFRHFAHRFPGLCTTPSRQPGGSDGSLCWQRRNSFGRSPRSTCPTMQLISCSPSGQWIMKFSAPSLRSAARTRNTASGSSSA